MQNSPRYHINNGFFKKPKSYGNVILHQIGRLYSEGGVISPEHTHKNLFELTIVTAGAGTIFAQGVPTEVKAGDIFLSYPNESHKICAPENTKFEYDFIAFSASDPYGSELDEIAQKFPADARLFRDERIPYLVALAISEFSSILPHTDELVGSILTQIIIYVVRDFTAAQRSTANVSRAEILCHELMSYIDTHIHTIQNLFELSGVFKYNYSYLSEVFRATTGTTLSEYYRSRRLALAIPLLKEDKYSCSEISERLGYSSPFAFSAAFKKKYGVSPQKYKKDCLTKSQ